MGRQDPYSDRAVSLPTFQHGVITYPTSQGYQPLRMDRRGWLGNQTSYGAQEGKFEVQRPDQARPDASGRRPGQRPDLDSVSWLDETPWPSIPSHTTMQNLEQRMIRMEQLMTTMGQQLDVVIAGLTDVQRRLAGLEQNLAKEDQGPMTDEGR